MIIMRRILFLALFYLFSATTFADETTSLLQSLSNATGAPSFENPVRQIIYPIWKQHLSNVKVDNVGDVFGLLPGNINFPKILIMAHMDEVGFLVRDITKNGFIQVEPLGGWRDQVVYAQRWIIMTKKGPIIGYSGNESKHIVPNSDQATNTSAATALNSAREMTIDIGARSKEDAMTQFGVRPGLPITPDTQFTVLNNTNRYLGKGFDDRAGLALATELIKKTSNTTHSNQIAFAATVQEEVGLRGAHVIANMYKPDVVLNIEACIAGDYPLTATPSDTTYPALGKGPCLYVYERSMLPSNNLVDWIVTLASKNKIPYQFATAINYGQDGSVLQQSNEGAAVINIGIPVRYAHQQAGVIERSDYDATLKLLEVILQNLDEKQLKIVLPVAG